MSQFNQKHIIYAKDPLFTCVKLGITNIFAGVSTMGFHDILEGDTVTFINHHLGFKRMYTVEVTHVRMYDNFSQLLENETVEKCLPGVDSINDAMKYYHQLYSEEDLTKYLSKVVEFVPV